MPPTPQYWPCGVPRTHSQPFLMQARFSMVVGAAEMRVDRRSVREMERRRMLGVGCVGLNVETGEERSRCLGGGVRTDVR